MTSQVNSGDHSTQLASMVNSTQLYQESTEKDTPGQPTSSVLDAGIVCEDENCWNLSNNLSNNRPNLAKSLLIVSGVRTQGT